MKKYFLALSVLAVLSVLIYYFLFASSAPNNINPTAEKNPELPEIKSFVVEKLPDFAVKDCLDRKGQIKTFTEKGQSIEKCVF